MPSWLLLLIDSTPQSNSLDLLVKFSCWMNYTLSVKEYEGRSNQVQGGHWWLLYFIDRLARILTYSYQNVMKLSSILERGVKVGATNNIQLIMFRRTFTNVSFDLTDKLDYYFFCIEWTLRSTCSYVSKSHSLNTYS